MSIKKNDIFTIPNLLSFFRIILIPIIMFSYLKYDNPILTASIVLLSGATDIIDGWIARKYNMTSDFGKMLDPIADKLTQLALLICLVTKFPNIFYIIALLVVKESIMTITGLLSIKNTNKVESAEWHGKVTTFLLYLTMIIHIIWNTISNIISNILLGACATMMIISLVMYTIRNGKSIKK